MFIVTILLEMLYSFYEGAVILWPFVWCFSWDQRKFEDCLNISMLYKCFSVWYFHHSIYRDLKGGRVVMEEYDKPTKSWLKKHKRAAINKFKLKKIHIFMKASKILIGRACLIFFHCCWFFFSFSNHIIFFRLQTYKIKVFRNFSSAVDIMEMCLK